MKKATVTLFLSLKLLASLFSQVELQINAPDIFPSPILDLCESPDSVGAFGTFTFNEDTNDVIIQLTVDFIPEPNDILDTSINNLIINLLTNGLDFSYSWWDYLQDIDICFFVGQSHITKTAGKVEAYLAGAGNTVYEKTANYSMNYHDTLLVISSIPTIIELPMSVAATFVSGQTFANPAESEAVATAEITGTVQNESVHVGKTVVWTGPNLGLVQQESVNDSKIAIIPVMPGANVIMYDLKAKLTAHSKLKPLGGLIPAGINTAVIANGHVTIGQFTGPNGSTLPSGLKIIGQNTGIKYSDYSNAYFGTIGVDEEPAESIFSVIPSSNPLKNDGYITIKNPNFETLILNVYDLLGNQICSKSIRTELESLDMPGMNLAEQPQGVYAIKVQSKNQIKTLLIVKG